MIQRIQSVYLFLIALLGILTLFMPLFAVVIDGKEYIVEVLDFPQVGAIAQVDNIYSYMSLIAALLIPVVAFLNIFLFKNRPLQIKITYILLFLIIIFYIFAVIFLLTSKSTMFVAYFFNVLNLVLAILTIIAIKKDEKLIRSLDRIR